MRRFVPELPAPTLCAALAADAIRIGACRIRICAPFEPEPADSKYIRMKWS